jgi:hypothetical protein
MYNAMSPARQDLPVADKRRELRVNGYRVAQHMSVVYMERVEKDENQA